MPIGVMNVVRLKRTMHLRVMGSGCSGVELGRWCLGVGLLILQDRAGDFGKRSDLRIVRA